MLKGFHGAEIVRGGAAECIEMQRNAANDVNSSHAIYEEIF